MLTGPELTSSGEGVRLRPVDSKALFGFFCLFQVFYSRREGVPRHRWKQVQQQVQRGEGEAGRMEEGWHDHE